jgi:hypothetical protein
MYTLKISDKTVFQLRAILHCSGLGVASRSLRVDVDLNPDRPHVKNGATTQLAIILALDWYGGPYNPDGIDVEQINVTLGRIANSYRPGRSTLVKK